MKQSVYVLLISAFTGILLLTSACDDDADPLAPSFGTADLDTSVVTVTRETVAAGDTLIYLWRSTVDLLAVCEWIEWQPTRRSKTNRMMYHIADSIFQRFEYIWNSVDMWVVRDTTHHYLELKLGSGGKWVDWGCDRFHFNEHCRSLRLNPWSTPIRHYDSFEIYNEWPIGGRIQAPPGGRCTGRSGGYARWDLINFHICHDCQEWLEKTEHWNGWKKKG